MQLYRSFRPESEYVPVLELASAAELEPEYELDSEYEFKAFDEIELETDPNMNILIIFIAHPDKNEQIKRAI